MYTEKRQDHIYLHVSVKFSLSQGICMWHGNSVTTGLILSTYA